MPKRKLYIAAYDVSDSRRLQKALKAVRTYASGGQKSVFECFLTSTERLALLEEVEDILDLEEDRFMLLPLANPDEIRTLGIAMRPADPDFYYVG